MNPPGALASSRIPLDDVEVRVGPPSVDGARDIEVDFKLAEALLAQAVSIPARAPGVIGVDLVDYAQGLQGRCIELHEIRSSEAADHVHAEFRAWIASLVSAGTPSFIGLHLCASADYDLMALVDACEPALSRLPDQTGIIWAATRPDPLTAAAPVSLAVVLAR